MPRHVQDLIWAERAEASPWPRTRSSGAKALGLQYERKVAKRLLRAEHNPWFRFQDRNGLGYCSPDFLWKTDRFRIVMECKLQDALEAWEQLEGLYLPVLREVFPEPIIPVVMVKYASQGGNFVESVTEAIQGVASKPAVHWIGHGPIQW
jgi:hypothetical protein